MSTVRKAVAGLAFALVALVCLILIWGSRLASSPEPVFTVESDLEIEAPIESVWRALANFERYPEWNPYAIRVEGRAAVGETITLTIVQEDWEKPLTVRPEIVTFEINRELGWRGRLLFSGLHETHHFFQLEERGPNRTRLHHAEEFRGLLPGWIHGPEARRHIKNAFRAMNEALKRRAERVDQDIADRGWSRLRNPRS